MTFLLSIIILILHPLLEAEEFSQIEKKYGQQTISSINLDRGELTLANGTIWHEEEADYRWDRFELQGELRRWEVGDRVNLEPREQGVIPLALHNSRTGSLIGVSFVAFPKGEVPSNMHWLSDYQEGSFWNDTDLLKLEDETVWSLPGARNTRREFARKWEVGDLLMSEVQHHWHDGPRIKIIFFNLSRNPATDYVIAPVESDFNSSPQTLQ